MPFPPKDWGPPQHFLGLHPLENTPENKSSRCRSTALAPARGPARRQCTGAARGSEPAGQSRAQGCKGPASAMHRRRVLQALAAVGFAPCLAALAGVKDPAVTHSVLVSAAVSVLGFLATRAIIPVLKQYTLKSHLSGKDINKKGGAARLLHWLQPIATWTP